RLVLVTHAAPGALRRAVGPGVEIVRAASYDEVRARLDAADVAVSPRAERSGFPMKLLNYMAAGKAIVASAGSAKGLRDGVSGRVVPDGDEGAFAAAVVELLSDRAARARLGAAARRAVEDPRAWDGVLARIEAVYRNVLAARGAASTTSETHASTGLPMALPECAGWSSEHGWGEVNPAFGEAAVHYTREAGRLALAGEIDAMVSAPLNKEAMHAAGHRYEGQTEILGELTGTRPAMLLLLGTMRVMLFTNHMALRAVCDYVRQDRVLDRLALADAALRDLGIARPRLAVAG